MESSETPEDIVNEFGKVMETSAPAPGMVADVAKLPYPKQQIKDGLIAALRSNDDPQMKEHLKVGYIQLADWQEGVGESNIGFDLSKIDPNQDANSLAKQVLEESEGTEYWMDKVKKEQEVLKQELHDLNLW